MTTRNLDLNPCSTTLGYITWTEGDFERQIEIGEFISFGRDPSNQIHLRDDFVSARHARIERKDLALVVRDLRSRNGTFVNGARIQEAFLRDGDLLQIGQQSFRFSIHSTPRIAGVELKSRNSKWAMELERLPGLAASEHPILLTGPSGAGKDVLAQAIHQSSPRRQGPLISVNCSALTESLAESELFGHRKGSFTGAVTDRQGAFEAARGGTLFLDEIGDLPSSIQPKLLRALENRQIRPVGRDSTIAIDVRIVAATHRDLKDMIFEKSFRADLFYRLNVLKMAVPALADRMEDFTDFLYTFSKEEKVRFSHAAIERLKRHSWPGNLRELRNLVRRARALFGEEEIKAIEITGLIDPVPILQTPTTYGGGQKSILKDIEYEVIRSRLLANNGNQRRTANELGIPKSTLHDRIRSYGIDLDKLFSPED